MNLPVLKCAVCGRRGLHKTRQSLLSVAMVIVSVMLTTGYVQSVRAAGSESFGNEVSRTPQDPTTGNRANPYEPAKAKATEADQSRELTRAQEEHDRARKQCDEEFRREMEKSQAQAERDGKPEGHAERSLKLREDYEKKVDSLDDQQRSRMHALRLKDTERATEESARLRRDAQEEHDRNLKQADEDYRRETAKSQAEAGREGSPDKHIERSMRLKEQHERRIESFDEQHRSKMQAVSLKDTQRQSEETERERANAQEEHDRNLKRCEEQYRRELVRSQAEAEREGNPQKHIERSTRLREQYEGRVESFNAQHRSLTEAMGNGRTERVSMDLERELLKGQEDHARELRKCEDDYRRDLERSQADADRDGKPDAHIARSTRLREQYDTKVQSLGQQHRSNVQAMRLKDSQRQPGVTGLGVRKPQEEHDALLRNAETEYRAELEKSQAESEREGRPDKHVDRADRLREQYEARVASLQRQHRSSVQPAGLTKGWNRNSENDDRDFQKAKEECDRELKESEAKYRSEMQKSQEEANRDGNPQGHVERSKRLSEEYSQRLIESDAKLREKRIAMVRGRSGANYGENFGGNGLPSSDQEFVVDHEEFSREQRKFEEERDRDLATAREESMRGDKPEKYEEKRAKIEERYQSRLRDLQKRNAAPLNRGRESGDPSNRKDGQK